MARGPGRSPISLGETSGFLTALARLPREEKGNYAILICQCSRCGGLAPIPSIKFRRCKACADCAKEMGPVARVVHGGAKRGPRDPLYSAYRAMRGRCESKNTQAYRWYGAKGIKVCEEWKDFAVFREWALSHGWEKNLTLDRLDETKGYSPNNCEYVDKPTNSRRMRAKYHFVKKSSEYPRIPYDDPCYGDY